MLGWLDAVLGVHQEWRRRTFFDFGLVVMPTAIGGVGFDAIAGEAFFVYGERRDFVDFFDGWQVAEGVVLVFAIRL